MDSTLLRPGDAEQGYLASLAGDGRPLLGLGAVALLASGLFAWFLAVTDQLLPHDLAWLTITPADLRGIADGRLVHFMAHDRAAFGGTLIAIGVLYLWLIRFPLAEGRRWAWWTVAGSTLIGFLSFLSYLGTGYLDSWHGVATLALLPVFGFGLAMTRRLLKNGEPADDGPTRRLDGGATVGRWLLLLTGFGMLIAGLTIVTIGTVVVFVPQDLVYIGLDKAALDALARRLRAVVAMPDEKIVSAGGPADAMYFIAAGEVTVVRDGSRFVLREGDFFGEMGLLDHRPRNADVISDGYCHLLLLSRRDFERLLSKRPEVRSLIEAVAMKRSATNPGAE